MKRNLYVVAILVVFAFGGSSVAFGQSSGKSHEPFAVGLGVNVSSLGIGVQAGIPVTHKSNARFGFNMFSYSRDFEHSGINYNGSLKLRSVEALYDFFPFGGFHLSPGVLIYNGNTIDAKASVPGGQSFDLGSTTYFSSSSSPVSGTGKLSLNKAAPMFLFGFGNLVPRTRHFSVTFDLGVVYHGTPKVTLGLAGSVCDAGGVNCRAVTDATVQTNLQSEITKLNKDAEPFKFWPVFSIGFGYKFGGSR